MSKRIDGKHISQTVLQDVAKEVNTLKTKGIIPGLAVVLVGEDPASKVYVGTKVKTCESLGINSFKYALVAETTQTELIALIKKLNADEQVHGILVQSPPPKHIDEMAVVATIDPCKDIDGFHAVNVGKNLLGEKDGFLPCTPAGVMELLARSDVNPAGKHVVILGRSNIVGKPMMALLIQKGAGADATVTCCHSRTKDLPSFTRQADILIAAIGKANFVTAEMIKEGAVVIDVGINRIEDPTSPRGYRIVGDVDFASVEPKASLITPVPGGVGPMTIAMLMHNTVRACQQQVSKECRRKTKQ